ncbi:hypothetical protein N5C40_09515 [Pseudomonas fulva]|uniref:hypothetical protein n=1 Tax=Pseudomonas fulva TaxID=47880 RepID=UPI0024475D2E|nr:hypothetical protein [Pseudomonas fulva]MDH1306781.1 hypothetical protein [Pseudomonas fulva]
MHRLPKLLLMFALTAAVTACDQKPSREEQIVAQLPLQEAYDHNIQRMAVLLAGKHPDVSQTLIEQVLRRHLTVDDQRQDLFRLYSEQNFTDAEFASIVGALQDPAKARALEKTPQGKRLSEKLTALMQQTAADAKVQAVAEQRMQDVEAELKALEKNAP